MKATDSSIQICENVIYLYKTIFIQKHLTPESWNKNKTFIYILFNLSDSVENTSYTLTE